MVSPNRKGYPGQWNSFPFNQDLIATGSIQVFQAFVPPRKWKNCGTLGLRSKK